MWVLPRLRGPQRQAFPQFMKAFAGWRRLHPLRSRSPAPWEVVVEVARLLLLSRRHQMALAAVLMSETYLRPSELLALTAQQVVWPTPGAAGAAGQLTLVVHASELGIASKVGEYDPSICLDLPRQLWLLPYLRRLCSRLAPSDPLFDFGYSDFAACFKAELSSARLDFLHLTLYCLRHGGASHDARMSARTLLDIRRRGQWRSWTSVRRYEKHGRLGMMLQSIPENQRQHLLQQSATVESRFARLWPLPSPAASAPSAKSRSSSSRALVAAAAR